MSNLSYINRSSYTDDTFSISDDGDNLNIMNPRANFDEVELGPTNKMVGGDSLEGDQLPNVEEYKASVGSPTGSPIDSRKKRMKIYAAIGVAFIFLLAIIIGTTTSNKNKDKSTDSSLEDPNSDHGDDYIKPSTPNNDTPNRGGVSERFRQAFDVIRSSGLSNLDDVDINSVTIDENEPRNDGWMPQISKSSTRYFSDMVRFFTIA
jgi:hypothetical protein